jgi:hypothetical protein
VTGSEQPRVARHECRDEHDGHNEQWIAESSALMTTAQSNRLSNARATDLWRSASALRIAGLEALRHISTDRESPERIDRARAVCGNRAKLRRFLRRRKRRIAGRARH